MTSTPGPFTRGQWQTRWGRQMGRSGTTKIRRDHAKGNRSEQRPLGCRCGNPVRLHEQIGRDLPVRIDLLDHLQGKGATPSQNLGGA